MKTLTKSLILSLIFFILYFQLISFFTSCSIVIAEVKNNVSNNNQQVISISDSLSALITRSKWYGKTPIYSCGESTYGQINFLGFAVATEINNFDLVMIHSLVFIFILFINIFIYFYQLNYGGTKNEENN